MLLGFWLVRDHSSAVVVARSRVELDLVVCLRLHARLCQALQRERG